MQSAQGQIIAGRYVLQSRLGRGTFGEVYEAFDINRNMIVALKLLDWRLMNPAAPWHEAQVLTALRSDFILPIHDAAIINGVPYIATDLAAHGSCEKKMEPCGVDPLVAVPWVRHASLGAARAHDAGLVHRDIKPDNIFLPREDAAVLGDFGIATLMNAAGEAPVGGTPHTMAPEVAAGGPTTVRSDVYSLGASLYALLAGRHAYPEADVQACLASICDGPPKCRLRDAAPNVGLALGQRIEKAMARDAGNRYANATDFAAALGELRPTSRNWRRTDEHPGHLACFRGEGAMRSVAATVCAVPAGKGALVEARHQPRGRRINAASRPPGPLRTLAGRLRTAMAEIR